MKLKVEGESKISLLMHVCAVATMSRTHLAVSLENNFISVLRA